MRFWKSCLLALASTALAGAASAQQPAIAPAAGPARYDPAHEATLVGNVVSFIENSNSAPFGARVSLQTPSGLLEVHLGDSRFLAANHFSIQPGDTLRVIGESLNHHGVQLFVARIIQKGTRALALRTPRGLPIPYVAPRSTAEPAASKRAV